MHPNTTSNTPQASANTAVAGVLTYVMQTLLRGKWVLILVPAIIVGAVLLYLRSAERVYEARSSIIIEMEGASQAALALAPTLGNPDVLIEVEILKSLDLAKRVAERLEARLIADIREDDRITYPILWDDDGDPRSALGLALAVQGRIDVAQIRRDIRVIEIKARSTSPHEAATIANLYAEAYTTRNLERSRQEAAGLKVFVEQQIESTRTSLNEAEEELQRYREQESAISLDEEARRLAGQMAELQTMRDQSQVELGMVQAELRSLENEAQDIMPGLYARVASGVEQEIQVLQQQIAGLQYDITNKYAKNPQLRGNESVDPELQRDIERVAQLRVQVETKAQTYVDQVLATGGIELEAIGRSGQGEEALAAISRLRRQITEKKIQGSGLEARLDGVNRRIAQYEREFQRIPAQSRQLAALERQQQSRAATYEWLLESFEEARIAEQSEFGYAQLLDAAEVPSDPVEPRPLYSIVLGLLLGGVIAMGVVFGREMLDNRIRRPEDLSALGIPLLGVTPHVHRWVLERSQAVGVHPSLVVAQRPSSISAEAYQRVIAQLELAAGGDRLLQVCLVTSGREAEGKSHVAANMAAAYAQAGQRTLLLDANLWNPAVHSQSATSLAPGLADAVCRRAAVQDCIRATAVANLYSMPIGAVDEGASALLSAAAVETLLTFLRRSFDRIIVDASGVLASGSALPLIPMADAVIVTARAGHTRVEELQETWSAIQDARTGYTGLVLSDFNAKEAYGYFGIKSYYGSFGSLRALRERSQRNAIGFASGDRIASGSYQPFGMLNVSAADTPFNQATPLQIAPARPEQQTPPGLINTENGMQAVPARTFAPGSIEPGSTAPGSRIAPEASQQAAPSDSWFAGDGQPNQATQNAAPIQPYNPWQHPPMQG